MGFNDRRGGFGRDRDSRGGFGGGRGGFGGRGGGFRDSRPREMHSAVCDKCKKECEVPFKPTEGKPILCSDCFKSAGNGGSRGGSSGGGMSAEQFNKIDAKLNKILNILEDLEIVDEDDDLIEDDEAEDDEKVTPVEDEVEPEGNEELDEDDDLEDSEEKASV